MTINREHIEKLVWPYVRNPHDMDDLTQEVLLKILVSGHEPTSSWLFTVVKNAAFDFFKKRKQKQQDAIGPVRIDPGHAAQLNARHDVRVALAAVEAMGPKCAEAFRLRYVEDNTEGQVAKLLGIPMNTAKARANRARRVAVEALSG